MLDARMLRALESKSVLILMTGITVAAIFAWLLSHGKRRSKAPSWFQRKLGNWKYLLYGRSMLQQLAQDAHGGLSLVIHPGHRLHVVTSERHMEEINADKSHLSMYAAINELHQMYYMVDGRPIPEAKKDADLIFLRAIRTMSARRASLFGPLKELVMRETFTAFANGQNASGSSSVRYVNLAHGIILQIHVRAYLGESFLGSSEFMSACLSYLKRGHIMAQLMMLLPTQLRPIVPFLVPGHRTSIRTILRYFDIEGERLFGKRAEGAIDTKMEPTLINIIAQTCPDTWDARRLSLELLTILFSTYDSTSTVLSQLIQHLAEHPDAVAALRQELKGSEASASFEALDRLPLLDSFFKESMRINCFDADGYKVRKGDMVILNQQQILQNPAYYPEPHTFQPFRFAKHGKDQEPAARSFENAQWSTTYSHIWPFWGSARQTCTGRHYIMSVLKMIVSHLILDYNIDLIAKEQLTNIEWGSVCLPYPSNRVSFGRRQNL